MANLFARYKSILCKKFLYAVLMNIVVLSFAVIYLMVAIIGNISLSALEFPIWILVFSWGFSFSIVMLYLRALFMNEYKSIPEKVRGQRINLIILFSAIIFLLIIPFIISRFF